MDTDRHSPLKLQVVAWKWAFYKKGFDHRQRCTRARNEQNLAAPPPLFRTDRNCKAQRQSTSRSRLSILPRSLPHPCTHPVSLCNEHFRLIYEGGLVEDGKTHFSRSAGCSAVGCTGVSAREGSGRLPIWLRAKAKWVFESGRSRSHPFFACKWEFKSGRGFSPSRPESE